MTRSAAGTPASNRFLRARHNSAAPTAFGSPLRRRTCGLPPPFRKESCASSVRAVPLHSTFNPPQSVNNTFSWRANQSHLNGSGLPSHFGNDVRFFGGEVLRVRRSLTLEL